MNPCKQCGAELPDQARFCFQCGAPINPPFVTPPEETPEPPPAGPAPAAPQLDFVQPALAGGMLLGLLSSLPFISAGNILCCMWVLGGGGLAVLMLVKQRPSGITYGDGAFVGVLSGLFGAVVATVISIPVRILSARFFESQPQALEEAFREIGLEGPFRDLMMRVASPEISAVTVFLTFFMNLLMFSLFAMIGGILTVAILNKRGTRGQTPRSPVSN